MEKEKNSKILSHYIIESENYEHIVICLYVSFSTIATPVEQLLSVF